MNEVKLVSTEVPLQQETPTVSPSAASTSVETGEPAPAQQVSEQVISTQDQIERSAERVEEAVANLNEYVQSVQRDLQFRLDDNSGKTVITVYDRSTEEVVRQIPDDVALRLARDLQQDEPIRLFNAKV